MTMTTMARTTNSRLGDRRRVATPVRPQGSLRQHDPDVASPCETVTLLLDGHAVRLPCLRCGSATVPISPVFFLVGRSASTASCRLCEAQHYLSLARTQNGFAVCYQRYTLRHPLEYYDVGEVPPIVRLHAGRHATDRQDSDIFAGPIVVYPRKRRFSQSEVNTLWRASKGRCHICRRHWALGQHGPRGWHIDHVIPHVGGGRDVERLPSLRVACGTCNRKKGKGYTEASIRLGLCRLVELLAGERGYGHLTARRFQAANFSVQRPPRRRR